MFLELQTEQSPFEPVPTWTVPRRHVAAQSEHRVDESWFCRGVKGRKASALEAKPTVRGEKFTKRTEVLSMNRMMKLSYEERDVDERKPVPIRTDQEASAFS